MSTKSASKIHKCRICGKGFARFNNCARHERYNCPKGMVMNGRVVLK